MEENHKHIISESLPSAIFIRSLIGFLLCVLIITTILFFTKHNESIECKFEVINQYPPLHLAAQQAGTIELLKKNNEQVQRGETIAIINNDYTDLEAINRLTKDIEDYKNDQLTYIDLAYQLKNNYKNSTLGSLQLPVIEAIIAIEDYKIYRNYSGRDLSEARNNAKRKSQEYINILKERDRIYTKDKSIATNISKRNEALLTEGAISSEAYDQFARTLIKDELDIINHKAQIKEIDFMLSTGDFNFEKQLADIQLLKAQSKSKVLKTIENLSGHLRNWESQNVLKATSNGTLHYTNYIVNNQQVSQGTTIANIEQNQRGKWLAFLKIPIKNSGQIREGQEVFMSFDNYPYQEYGIVKTTLNSLSQIPTDAFYEGIVELSDTLKSTYTEEIIVGHHTTGSAEVIVQQKNVFTDIANKFRDLFYNR